MPRQNDSPESDPTISEDSNDTPSSNSSNDTDDDAFLRALAPKPQSGIPFLLRHRFFNWLIPLLEACCLDFVQEKLGGHFIPAILETLHREDVSQIDLVEWRKIMEEACIRGELSTRDFFPVREKKSCPDMIFLAAEAVRHAAVHRRDMELEVLLDAVCLPELLRDTKRKAELERMFELVMKGACQGKVSLDTVYQALPTGFENPSECSTQTQTQLFKGFESLIEKRLFFYTRRHYPQVLQARDWTVPEQGEIPQWDYIYGDGPSAIQDDFPDDDGNLLAICLGKARTLRNDVSHRHYRDDGKILDRVHNSIRMVMVLGNHISAIKIEIAAECWFTGATREEVLRRLSRVYLLSDVTANADVLVKRRESKRRAAIAKVLEASLLPNIQLMDRNSAYLEDFTLAESVWDSLTASVSKPLMSCCFQELNCKYHAVPYTIPDQIRLTPPDDWDTRRQTFSDSMHPALKVLHEPEWSTIWDLCVAQGELAWEHYSSDDSPGGRDSEKENNTLGTLDSDDEKKICGQFNS